MPSGIYPRTKEHNKKNSETNAKRWKERLLAEMGRSRMPYKHKTPWTEEQKEMYRLFAIKRAHKKILEDIGVK